MTYLENQKQLVAEAEREEEIITANRRLIELMDLTKVLVSYLYPVKQN